MEAVYTQKIFLQPGEVVISTAPQNVWTVLGSCISIVLYSRRLKVSAICHAKLPEQKKNTEKHCSVFFSTEPKKWLSIQLA